MEKETIYLSSAYLAPVEYYTKLLAYNRVYVETATAAPLPRRTARWRSRYPSSNPTR